MRVKLVLAAAVSALISIWIHCRIYKFILKFLSEPKIVYPARAHLLIANKVVNIWECFETTTTGVTCNHTNEKEPPSTIHKLPTNPNKSFTCLSLMLSSKTLNWDVLSICALQFILTWRERHHRCLHYTSRPGCPVKSPRRIREAFKIRKNFACWNKTVRAKKLWPYHKTFCSKNTQVGKIFHV